MKRVLLFMGWWIFTCAVFLGIFDFAVAQNPLVKQWDKRFGGTNQEYLKSLEQTYDGGFILGGYSYSQISGDKTQQNWDTIAPISSDYWIVKFCDTTLTTSITQLPQLPNYPITITPNPASEYVNIQLSESFKTFGKSGLELRLTDVLGRAVFTKTISSPSSGFRLLTSGFLQGIYFLSVKTEKEVLCRKLIIQH